MPLRIRNSTVVCRTYFRTGLFILDRSPFRDEERHITSRNTLTKTRTVDRLDGHIPSVPSTHILNLYSPSLKRASLDKRLCRAGVGIRPSVCNVAPLPEPDIRRQGLPR